MESATTFEQRKQEVSRLFESAASLAGDVQREDVEKRLQETEDRFTREQLYVVVCGEFKQGKSSFINALLEEPGLCPVDILVTTSLVSTISYASEEKITVYLGEPGNAKPKEISRNEIADYVSEQRNRRNRQNARLLTVETPNEQLKSGLFLVDTPGIGGVYLEHSSITYGFIPNADVVLFITDALRPLSKTELEFIKRVAEHCRNLIYVVTKKDEAPSIQTILEDNRAKLSQVLKRPAEGISITAVSNLLKERYLKSHNPRDLEDSNFPAFERELWEFLGEQRGQILLISALDRLVESVADMRAPHQAGWEAYQNRTEQELNEIERELTDARDALRELLDNRANWRQDLSDGVKGIREEVLERRFEVGKEDVEFKARQYLQDDDLLQQPTAIGEKVAADLNLMINNLGKAIIARAAELQQEIEASSKLNLNPFKRSSLFEEIEIVPPSPLGKVGKQARSKRTRTETIQDALSQIVRNAPESVGAASTIGTAIGAFIGSFMGTTALPGFGSVAGWQAGGLIGSGIGTLVGAGIGATKGVQTSLRSTEELTHSERKRRTEEIISAHIKSSFKKCSIGLRDELTGLEETMREDLEDKISREEENLNRSIEQFQKARQASEQDAAANSKRLSSVLERFDRLESQIQATVNTVFDNLGPAQPPTPDEEASR